MSNERTNEFLAFIQAFIDANGEQTLGKRIYWKNFPEKIAKNAVKGLKIPDNESIMMIIDSTILGSGKEGMALTDWGVRYNDGVKAWSLTWNDLSGKYSFAIIKTDGALGIKADALLLQAKPGDDFAVNKEASMSMADIKYDILARILSKSCQIFTGKSVDMVNTNINNIPESKPEPSLTASNNIPEPKHEDQPEHEPSQTTRKAPEKLTRAEKAEIERSEREAERDNEFLEKVRNGMSGRTGSFLLNNIGGVIICLALSLLVCITSKVPLAFILSFPLSFVGFFIGNKLRLWLHPDLVFASGFFGLLKEQLFWRFGPQLIGALIGAMIGGAIFM
jgi:hypothetical protein